MQEKLVIYLHAQDIANPSWATGAYTHQGEAESLAQAAIDREVVVIVPAEDVVLMATTLPKMSRSRLAQAIPYALEEQLTAEVEELHFASGGFQADGTIPVAVVAHEKMQQWLSLLQSWHVSPNGIVPATLALPPESVMRHTVTVVRTGAYSGFACDQSNAAELLAGMQLTDVTLEDVLNRIAKNSNVPPMLNLLQGKYAAKQSKFPAFPKLKLGWKVAAYLAAAWVSLLFLYPAVSYGLLQYKLHSINSQIAVIYKHHFPQATAVVAPKTRMQDKLQALSTQTGENHLFLLMAYLGKGMTEATGVKLKRLDFQDSRLVVDVTAVTPEDFSTFSSYLSRQGLEVKQRNATLTNGRVSATLQVE